ncbi:hypothetical protein JCM17960_30370 [Magnetospira thiophila]
MRRDEAGLERIIERARVDSSRLTKASGVSDYPILDHLRSLGGVDPKSKLAAELAHYGIRPGEKAARGLFKKGGLKDVDNLERRDALKDMPGDGTYGDYADRQEILDAIQSEWMGRPVRTQEDQDALAATVAPVEDLLRVLDELGLDINEMSNQEIIKAIREATAEDGGLEQAINAGVDENRQVAVVDLTKLPNSAQTPQDLMAELKVWAEVEIPTSDQDKIVQILRSSRRRSHIVRSGAPIRRSDFGVRTKSIENIIDVLGASVLIESTPNRKVTEKPDVDSYHRFYVPVWDGQKVAVIRLVAEQTKAGIQVRPGLFDLYDVVVERKAPAAVGGLPSGSAPSKAGQGPSSINIREMLSGIKDTDGHIYFQAARHGTDPRILYQTKRGSYNPATRTISLFEQKNLTTLLHESGHAFLEILRDIAADPNAPQQIRDDWKSVLDWMGVETFPTDTEALRPLHEKWARAFEDYLMTGKPPSEDLRPAFRRFADWLVGVYKDLRGLSKDAGHKVTVH